MIRTVSALARRVADGLGSKWAWRIVVGFFVVEALWLVFSAQYPMAFDENYHFGLIKLHAAQWVPFFTGQPDNAGVYGEIARDPSYLYHWLLSFPYRLASAITSSQTAQVIFLRLLNVAMFTGGLLLYRRVMARLGVGRALSTSLFAVFVLVPVVPFLAAHINYDNLLFLAVPLTVLLGLRLLDGFRAGRVDASVLLVLLTVLFLSSLIKYPFLPVFAATALCLIWRLWREKLLGRAGLHSFVMGFRTLTRFKQVLLVAVCLVSFGLFAERYAANIIIYHDPVPACDAVISQDDCKQYGPYLRDFHYVQNKPAGFHPNLPVYVGEWLYGMWFRLFFAINYNYATRPPLFVIATLAIVLALAGLAGMVLRFRWLFASKPLRQLVLWVTAGYVLVLFADGFSSYAKTAQPVAINGRYLIPFLPFLLAFGGLAWANILRRYSVVKIAAASLVIAVFLLQGGGTMTFIIRSGDDWMWNDGGVRAANRVVRSAAWPLMAGKDVY